MCQGKRKCATYNTEGPDQPGYLYTVLTLNIQVPYLLNIVSLKKLILLSVDVSKTVMVE